MADPSAVPAPDGPAPRIAAAAGVVGGLVWVLLPVLFALVFLGDRGAASAALSRLLPFAGVVCMAVSLAGFHHYWGRERYGRRGRAGFVVSLAGFVLLLPGSTVPAGALPPALARLIPLGFFAGLLAVAVGQALLGIDARRAGLLPPVATWLLIWALPAGSAFGIAASFLGAGTFALAVALLLAVGLPWIAVGAACWRSAGASTRE